MYEENYEERDQTDSPHQHQPPSNTLVDEIENVFVAIRIRPFNQRELKRSAKTIVNYLDLKNLLLIHPDDGDNQKRFTFDRIYWSHDGFLIAQNGLFIPDSGHPNESIYADQKLIFQSLAIPLLNNAWKGYNVSLFSYGQTGSGKSFTMVGYEANEGVVPRMCQELFNTIENRKGLNINSEIYISMLELYSEVVQDLLDTNLTTTKKRGLKIREHPTKGFFAEGLKRFLVSSLKEINEKIHQGVTNRSISATNMNEMSSRSHMIIMINIKQRSINKSGNEETKSSVINLVDLAGSERLNDLTGGGRTSSVHADRFRESVAINQSLSCLGNCIHALAEKASGRKVKVPYRESVLTRLLMNTLGGNSKTAMIANISPADINYEETLSTLRYADRAKHIQNYAKINIDPTEKIVKDLKEENDKLKQLLEKETLYSSSALSRMELYDETKAKLEEEIEAIMIENERRMKELRDSYEDRLRQERENKLVEAEQRSDYDVKQTLSLKEKETNPHLSNLNFDEQLVGKIIFIIQPGSNLIGKSDDCDIKLMGPSIQDHHAVINRTESDKIILERCEEDCRVLLNGQIIQHKVNLSHNDRLLFGTSQLYLFKNPIDSSEETNDLLNETITYELAREEIASKAGYSFNNDDNSMEQALSNRELLELVPAVDEANAISEELEKMVHFEIILVSPLFLGKIGRKPEPFIKVVNSNTGQEFEWTIKKFLDRLYLMKEIYHNYETGEEEWDLSLSQDPFLEDARAEFLIGTAQLYLQPLAYMVEIKEHLPIVNHVGHEIGVINIEMIPCDVNGREYEEKDNVYVESPQELLGNPLSFVVKVLSCRNLPEKFTDIYVKYLLFIDEEYTVSDKVSVAINPNFNFRKLFEFLNVTQALIEYLKDGILNVEVWGKQLPKPESQIANGFTEKQLNGKEMLQEELAKHGSALMNGFVMNGRVIDPNKQSIIVELLLMKKQQARLHQRIENIKKLVEIADNQRRRLVPVDILKELIFTTNSESVEEILTQLADDQNFMAANKDVTNSQACQIS